MSVSINKVIIGGYVGQDPNTTTFQDGGKITNCSVATNYSYKNQSGERVDIAEWHRLVFKGKIADIAEKYITKGKYIYVEGRKQSRSYQNQQGQDVYITEIIVQELKLGPDKDGEKTEPKNQPKKNASQPVSHNPFSANIGADSGEDDLPF